MKQQKRDSVSCKVHLTATENVPGDIDCRCPRRTSPCDKDLRSRLSRGKNQQGKNSPGMESIVVAFVVIACNFRFPGGNRTREVRNSIILLSHLTISI